jgi:hypothetical protein
MRPPFIAIGISLTLLFSCKKEESVPAPEVYVPTVAPCEITPQPYDSVAVYYNASMYHPEAKYRIVLSTTNAPFAHPVEFAFNKVPVSGMYYMVDEIDTNNLEIANQLAFAQDSGSFTWESVFSEWPEVYVEKTDQELIISYCTMTNTGIVFDNSTLTYRGNKPGPYKVRVQF